MAEKSFAELYSGKRAVLGDALISHDPYDQFAWTQEWRFAIAEYLLYWRDYRVPDFRSAYEGWDPVKRFNALHDESSAFDDLWQTSPSTGQLLYAYNILTRFREWLRIAEQDY